MRAVAVVALALAAACTGGDLGDVAAPESTTSTATTVQPCPSPVPSPAIVTTFRGPDAACVPIGQASIYRCSLGTRVPVALVGGRRFLGGVDAAPVEPDPAAVVFARAADGTRLASVAGDPDGVRVITRQGTERWPLEVGLRPSVFVVGDSVILGAQNELAAAFGAAGWSFTMDAAVNRSTGQGLEVLRARRGEIADVAVIGLGYNDGGDVGAWSAVATQLTDELASVRLVVWLTLREARGYYAEDNGVLFQLAANRPNVALADWRLASLGVAGEEFSTDNLHLHPAAAQAMAGLVLTTVQGWAATHPDRGDQSCRPAIDAAVAAPASPPSPGTTSDPGS